VENFRLPGDAFGYHPTLREETRGEGFGPLYEAPSILSRVLSETYLALELFPLSFLVRPCPMNETASIAIGDGGCFIYYRDMNPQLSPGICCERQISLHRPSLP